MSLACAYSECLYLADEAAAVARLNALPDAEAVAELRQCCASLAWAQAMAAQRPYRDVGALLDSADVTWQRLGAYAWRDAFDGHPRIGERTGETDATATATQRQWAAGEQAAATASADESHRVSLTAAQQEYEGKFGHIFLICATGKSAAEILEALGSRLENDADTELRVAAEEQRRITRLRLEKMLRS